jgi:hypothetical protein
LTFNDEPAVTKSSVKLLRRELSDLLALLDGLEAFFSLHFDVDPLFGAFVAVGPFDVEVGPPDPELDPESVPLPEPPPLPTNEAILGPGN